MKKIALFTIIFAVVFASCKKDDEENSTPSSGSSTITITSSDLGGVDDTYYHKIDSSNVDTLSLEVKNGIVDLSMLVSDYNDTTRFRSPSDYTSGSLFNNANLVLDAGNNRLYMNKASDKVEILGMSVDMNDTTEINIINTDNLTMLEFPLAVGDTLHDTSTGSGSTMVNLSGFQMEITLTLDLETSYKNISQEKVKTPTGTETCIKQYVQSISKMTISPDISGNGPQIDTTYFYRYYAKNKGDVFVEVKLDKEKNNNEINYLQ